MDRFIARKNGRVSPAIPVAFLAVAAVLLVVTFNFLSNLKNISGDTDMIYGPSPSIEWTKCFGGKENEIFGAFQATADGGYIVTGGTESNNGGGRGVYDCWIAKLDASGNFKWRKTYGSSGYDVCRSIHQTEDGGYIFAGAAVHNGGRDSGKDDIYVVKLNALGEIMWQKHLGTAGYDSAYSVRQTSGGGYIVTGESESSGFGAQDEYANSTLWVVKLAEDGATEWKKTLGGDGNEKASSIKETSDGGYIIAGWSATDGGGEDGDAGGSGFWVVKLSPDGETDWQNTLGGSGRERAYSASQTSDGGYIVAGSASSGDGDVEDGGYRPRLGQSKTASNAWIVKLNQEGAIVWQKCFGGDGDDGISSIHQTEDGGYIASGTTNSGNGDVSGGWSRRDIWVIRLDGDGDMLWQKRLGGSADDGGDGHHYGRMEARHAPDGGYVVMGRARPGEGDVPELPGKSKEALWVVKLQADVERATE